MTFACTDKFDQFNRPISYLSYLLALEIAVRHLPLRSVLVIFVYTGAGVVNMWYNHTYM